MKNKVEKVIQDLLIFLNITKKQRSTQQELRMAAVKEVCEKLDEISETLAFKLQNPANQPTLTVQLAGLADPSDKLPNNFPKNFRFVLSFGEFQMQGEDKLLDFDEEAALVQAFKLSVDSFPDQKLKVQIWQIGEVQSLYDQSHLSLNEIESLNFVTSFNQGVKILVRCSMNEGARKTLQIYRTVTRDILREIEALREESKRKSSAVVQRRLKRQAKKEPLFKEPEPVSVSYSEGIAELDQILGLIEGRQPSPKARAGLSPAHQPQPQPQAELQRKITEAQNEEEEESQFEESQVLSNSQQ